MNTNKVFHSRLWWASLNIIRLEIQGYLRSKRNNSLPLLMRSSFLNTLSVCALKILKFQSLRVLSLSALIVLHRLLQLLSPSNKRSANLWNNLFLFISRNSLCGVKKTSAQETTLTWTVREKWINCCNLPKPPFWDKFWSCFPANTLLPFNVCTTAAIFSHAGHSLPSKDKSGSYSGIKRRKNNNQG